MQDDNTLDFNFWPSFADLMLALVLILVLVLFLVIAIISVGTVNLSDVQKNQDEMVNKIAAMYAAKPEKLSDNLYGISINQSNSHDIIVKNEPTLQRITFSDNILFLPDDDQLNDTGQRVLQVVGESLKQQLTLVGEIQIQGHADTGKTARFPSNVHLASSRAISVYTFLQKTIGIDPAQHLMSANSFGEFKPIQRSEDDATYDWQKIETNNSSLELKGKNRRIELLLFYRLKRNESAGTDSDRERAGVLPRMR
jgi:flagellar motor protein MotB